MSSTEALTFVQVDTHLFPVNNIFSVNTRNDAVDNPAKHWLFISWCPGSIGYKVYPTGMQIHYGTNTVFLTADFNKISKAVKDWNAGIEEKQRKRKLRRAELTDEDEDE